METVRRAMTADGWKLTVLVLGVLSLQGCAALGLAILAVGAGTAAGQGVSYTLDSIAYKTFTASVDGLEAATLRTLNRMDITVERNEAKEGGRAIAATAGDRAVHVELERLTERTSRMRVVVKQDWFFKDKATATEIIVQTAQTFDDEPALARLTKATAAPPVYRHTAKTTSTPTIVTTASGRSALVAGGPGRSSKKAGVAPMDGRSTFSRSLTDPGGHGSAHGDAVSHGRGSNHGGGPAAGRDR